MFKKSCELSIGVFCALVLSVLACLAQVPGQNINMVSGTEFPGGDPYLQKQNEGSLAVSTRNPCHLLGGSNDYRAVNLPGLPGDQEIGDAWVGLYKSTNCGQTWWSTLVPGYPQDSSAQGQASPAKGFSTGADPNVRSGLAGFFGYAFIAFNRSTGAGKLLLARLIDNNNKEAGDPIQYINTTVFDSGSNGRFLDKPSLAISAGKGTCTINGQTIPASTVHMAWTVFVGNDQVIRTKVYYAKSSNCGATLDGPATKLSESFPVNQGTAIAVSPVDGSVYVAWRQFATDKTTSAILFAKSTDGGNTFTKAMTVPLGTFQPFDQSTTNVTFRTNAYATMTFDQFGRLYLAVATRGYAATPNQTRIVITTTTDGVMWTPPTPVEPDPDSMGHQIMPALTYAGGKLNLIWYDFRDDAAGDAPKTDTYVKEVYPIRHTLDVRGAQAPAQQNGALAWTNYGVLQLADPSITAPRISQYVLGNYGGIGVEKQLQHNPPNLRLYAGGTRPFFGDYLDVAGLAFMPKRINGAQQWVVNDGSSPTSGALTFHAVWTDNRNVRTGPGTLETEGVDGAVLNYMAPGSSCTAPALTGTRNANTYTSRITPGLYVAAPGNAKPAVKPDATLIQRAFPVLVQNNTGQEGTFTMTIANQPETGTASFTQTGAVVASIDVIIPGHSSATRTVYISSAERFAAVQVNVVEVTNSALSASTLLNPDIQNPDIQNPDIQNPDIQNPDIQNAEVHNPDIQNPDIQNPDIQNPDIQNPDIQNPDIQNPDIQNPDIQNPDIQNPDIQNPDIQNPDIQNPDIQNGAVNDYSVDVTNTGNTTSAYQVKVTVGGDTSQFKFQLVGRRVYKTPAADGCALTEQGQNQVLFKISNPDLGPLADGFVYVNSPSVTNATLLLAPGETVKVTLRALNINGLTPPPGTYPQFCPIVDTVGASCPSITNPVTVEVKAQAANTGETTPVTATLAPVDLVVSSFTHSPQFPITSDTVTFTAVVTNTGTSPAAASTLLFTIGSKTAGAPGMLVPVPSLAAGASYTVQRQSVLTAGDYTNTAVADYLNTVIENNETNNSASDAFTVFPATPVTLVVTNTNPSGPGSLRQATVQANGHAPYTDTISFAIPGAGAHTIAPSSALPQITDAAIIDGTTQPGYVSTPLIELTGTNAGSTPGLSITAGNSTVRGLAINGFAGNGILLSSGGGNVLQANYIGTDVTGTTAVPNTGNGVQIIDSASNTIGGSLSSARNVVSGNTGEGIRVDGAPSTGNLIQGNYIGVGVTGLAGLGNGASGVYLRRAPGNSVVANVISGNLGFAGVAVCGSPAFCGGGDIGTPGNTADGNIVRGNYVGTNASASAALGNAGIGLSLDGATSNTIGGNGGGDANVISANAGEAGVLIWDGATGNVVRGNYIGTDVGGTVNLGNTAAGVRIRDAGTDNNVVSGVDADRTGPNTIRFNGGGGIEVLAGTGNRLRINRIDLNAGLSIDLGTTGVTPNDLNDPDTGANDLQNTPVLGSAVLDAGVVWVAGTLNSTPSSTFTIDLYVSSACDPSGSGPGRQWFGGTTVLTNTSGDAAFNVGFGGVPVSSGDTVTALATSGDFVTTFTGTGNTSEFSGCATVTVPAPLPATSASPAMH